MVKIKQGFVMRKVASQSVVIAVGKASEEFHGMINLNDSGSCIWKCMEEGMEAEEIASKITEEFDIDIQTAMADIEQMQSKMKELGIVEA